MNGKIGENIPSEFKPAFSCTSLQKLGSDRNYSSPNSHAPPPWILYSHYSWPMGLLSYPSALINIVFIVQAPIKHSLPRLFMFFPSLTPPKPRSLSLLQSTHPSSSNLTLLLDIPSALLGTFINARPEEPRTPRRNAGSLKHSQ